MQPLARQIQVNIPFTMLKKKYLDRFVRHRLNPEIGLDALALEGFSASDFKSISSVLQDNGLRTTLHGPFIDLSAGSPDPAVWELTRMRFEQVLRLVPVFRPLTVVCHLGYEQQRYGFIRQAWVENSLKLWTWLAQRLAAENTRLMLENVFEHGPGQIRMILDHLPANNIGFCLDIGHMSAFGREPLSLWLKELGGRLGQLHLHDNHGERDEHLALGQGTIELYALFNFLKERKEARPVITLEPHREEDFWPSLRWLKRLWPW